MTKSAHLTDIQLILLANAASRDTGSLLPPSETIDADRLRIRKSVEQLMRRGLAVETDWPDGTDAWRMEGERAIGVVITKDGRIAIHVEKQDDEEAIDAEPALKTPPRAKIDTVITLLRRAEGATLGELVEVTGWLPHSTRAALTGLRKKGYAIVRGKRDDVTFYTLATDGAA